MAAASATASQSTYRNIAGMVGDWIRQGTEGFVATEKILLDLAAQQNALALTIVRERVGIPMLSTKKLADFAGKGIKNLMEAQRCVLDLVARQNGIMADGLKPMMPGAAQGLASVMYDGLDNLIAAQKHLLDIVEAQAEGAVNDFGKGRGFNAARLTDLAQEASLNCVKSQKKFLAIVEKQIVKKDTAEEPDKPGERPDIFEMAKQSTDSLIGTLQKLLDLATAQVQTNVKLAQDMIAEGAPATSMSEVVKKSADSFVAAQKALLDLASKPRKPQGPDQSKAAAA